MSIGCHACEAQLPESARHNVTRAAVRTSETRYDGGESDAEGVPRRGTSSASCQWADPGVGAAAVAGSRRSPARVLTAEFRGYGSHR
eukprot:298702-Chlamydomonas_euryale.AAC.2